MPKAKKNTMQIRSRRIRHSFARSKEILQIPSLIDIQEQSYQRFLQRGIPENKSEDIGLINALKSTFPIKDFSGKTQLELVSYTLEEPKHDIDGAKQKGLTYASSLRAKLRLIVWDSEMHGDRTAEKLAEKEKSQDKNAEKGAKSIRHMREQEVYLGDIPLMTGTGTFVINGIERVVVSQLHRSPGVFFDHDHGTYGSSKYLFMARVIPFAGSWLDIEFDSKDLIYVRIDRKRKFLVTTLLMALFDKDSDGMSREDILTTFYDSVKYRYADGAWTAPFIETMWLGAIPDEEVIDADSGKAIFAANIKITNRAIAEAQKQNVKRVFIKEEKLCNMYIAKSIFDPNTGEVCADAGEEITSTLLMFFNKNGINEIDVLNIDHVSAGAYIRNTLAADKNQTRQDALFDIYRVIRQGESPTIDGAQAIFFNTFFNSEKYDLSEVGRIKLNARLGLSTDTSVRVLEKQDIIAIVKKLIELREGKGAIDDIDSLANRRVRSVGELVESQYRAGLVRMKKGITERMSSVDLDQAMPSDLLNSRPLSTVIREFFGSSPLSQFMDQTNILSEVSHKRRLSALGPGGITRNRAAFEVRDVHSTHYGKICPITTPEGGNIGLIVSKTVYGRVNKYGFIESPYRKVTDGKLTDEVEYLSSIQEEGLKISQANLITDKDGNILDESVTCRYNEDFMQSSPKDVDFADVSPRQIISIEAGLIPFMENDDVSRALMGANMQRQAVPLLKPQAPLIGTGLEETVAIGSGAIIIAERSGIVDQVDAGRIVIRATEKLDKGRSTVDIYNLVKFQKSNAGTCINQRPLVNVGQYIKEGDIIADGPATDMGELALGRNVLVAFMSWNGYCFEDSIVLSQRLVKDSAFTSIHIDEFDVTAMDMRLGPEEITRDIPGVAEESLRHLDEAGIAYIGAKVSAGDILVGRVSPKAESPVAPEEKLLRAIFADKASDVKDTSLRVPPGVSGTVVDVRIFSRRGIAKDDRATAIDREAIAKLAKDKEDEQQLLENGFDIAMRDLLIGKTIVLKGKTKKTLAVDENSWAGFTKAQKIGFTVENEDVQKQIDAMRVHHQKVLDVIQKRYEQRIDKVLVGDDLQPSVLKVVKVFLAVKRQIQSGDKMAGRHGNKGVVSIVVPEEDMPYLADGTPVDMVLNPLGLPSRMNIGQILETHLGWASLNIGQHARKLIDKAVGMNEKDGPSLLCDSLCEMYQNNEECIDRIKSQTADELFETAEMVLDGVPMACPVFEGAKAEQITELLEKAGCKSSGQETLYDGRTGEPFDRPITVGIIYMMKLHHLVDEKIHARSVGHYSLVTQQPLGGKSQFGGQRLGEMEVWAIEAYGAAYILQEMLTVKSDDVRGRVKLYESIVSGKETFQCGIPESFNVFQKEVKTLCLNLECYQDTSHSTEGASA